MKELKQEIEANFKRFTTSYQKQVSDVSATLASEERIFLTSFFRLTSLQAWRSELLESRVSAGALDFFLEAQNDAVISHVLARSGNWRSALKSLRSCIENVMQCMFYMDHPVELELWPHTHLLNRTELEHYFEKHPLFKGVPQDLTGLPTLHKEYSVLNGAVHGSARSFRMTADAGQIKICTSEKASLGAWSTREKNVISSLNLLMLTLFRQLLSGAALVNLRKAVSLTLPTLRISEIKTHFAINLPTS